MIEKVAVVVPPALSVTVSVPLYVPGVTAHVAVTVAETAPFEFVTETVSPAGAVAETARLPAASCLSETDAIPAAEVDVPPCVVRAGEFGLMVICGAEFRTVRKKVRVAVKPQASLTSTRIS